MREPWLLELAEALGDGQLVTDPAWLLPYACDAYTLEQEMPRAVVLPQTGQEVARAATILHRHGIPYLARGAGTSLSGGATPLNQAVIIHLSRLNRILAVDVDSRVVECEPGVVNAYISRQLAEVGGFYAPDPSSQQACTIGGNFAENSGGPHCLKYGVTINHVLQAEVVLADGMVVTVGNLAGAPEPLDYLGLLVGSEGTLGIVTRLWLRMLPLPKSHRTTMAWFDDVDEASRAVSEIIAAGIIPAALEMMDALAMAAVEKGAYPVGYPADLAAVLLIEVDGEPDAVADDSARLAEVLAHRQVRAVHHARDEQERALWWANRKTAFGAMGLISPSYYVQDGVIARSRLPAALREIAAIAARYQIRIANVFHAGDGNLHPLLLYDDRDREQIERVRRAGSEILAVCVRLGGTISGEHGIGIEKREDMLVQFTGEELAAQLAIKAAFDPLGVLNPGKLIPTPARCRAESGAPVASGA
ncbi:MAG: FAD-binding protein [Thermaerobacter sp.]|nr:FAD-binding protein [Thermaerobacter sp.]